MTSALIQAPATTLRERFIEDMSVRRLSRATPRNYVRDITRLAKTGCKARVRIRICARRA